MAQGNDMTKGWLFLANAIMCVGWLRVLFVFLLQPIREELTCSALLTPAVSMALFLSFLELFNAIMGFTRSKPHQVLLFAVVRFGVEMLVAPLIPCGSWQHLLTTMSWALGDTIRFGCFAADVLQPGGYVAKAIRYTAGPLLFPFGASGEALMVVLAAQDDRPKMYLAAMLWPAGFYPLYTQLLKQRKKFFSKSSEPTKADIKKA